MTAAVRMVGHGSLMSADGLGEPTLAATRDARLRWVDGVERGFHKPVKRGGCLAMDVGLAAASVEARTLAPDEPSPRATGRRGSRGCC